MPIALTDDHRQLADVVRRFFADQQVRAAARQLLDADVEIRPEYWDELAGLGMLGLHLPTEHGGSGYTLLEAAVLIEEAGRALAPGPLLPTVWASAVLAAAATEEQQRAFLGKLADGSQIGAVATAEGRGVESSCLALGAQLSDLVLIPVGEDLAIATSAELEITAEPNLDPTRRVARVRAGGAGWPAERLLLGARPLAVRIGRVLAAAEAAGIAHSCVEAATEYANVRVQFGRPIGTYQAVKHHAANMFVEAELTTAAAWDAARAGAAGADSANLAAAVAASIGLPAAVRGCQRNIQLHGGIGFTWEHDAHMFLRRAAALASVFGPAGEAQSDVTVLTVAGVRRKLNIELPPEAEEYRGQVSAFRALIEQLPPEEQRRRVVEGGYAVPDWPKPWGLDATPVQQLVIDDELSDVEKPDYAIGEWIMRTLLMHGTSEQVDRLLPASLSGELVWCQLFSEPNAGSDAAGITTKAQRVDGGWSVTGQKVWTTFGPSADYGFATVRTDPDAPKRKGITTVVVDMRADGVEVRPLREATGESMFSEVFLNEVFVPDTNVIGPVNGGWKVASSALASERVSIGGRTTDGPIDLVELYRRYGTETPGAGRAIGALLAEEHGLRLLNLRLAARAVEGQSPGPEGNVSKLLFGEHHQRVADLALELGGTDAALAGAEHGGIGHALLWTRMLTIGGGTAEIVRNQIAERILGLPRDPLVN